jgi:hypothetical protein
MNDREGVGESVGNGSARLTESNTAKQCQVLEEGMVLR